MPFGADRFDRNPRRTPPASTRPLHTLRSCWCLTPAWAGGRIAGENFGAGAPARRCHIGYGLRLCPLLRGAISAHPER